MSTALIPRLTCFLALSSALLTATSQAGPAGSFDPSGPTVPFPRTDLRPRPVPAAVRQREAEVARRPTAAGYRSLAEAYEAAQLYQEAANTYRREAAMRRQQGDVQAARVVQNRVNRWDSRLLVYQEQPAGGTGPAPALYEPDSGCYIGAILTGDERFPNDFSGFNRATGKQHSVFFDYCHYGKPFPARWARAAKAAGAAVQIALEPNGGLEAVKNDAYLREFARQARATGMPIFLRFAAEMNGDWTRYGGKGREQQYIRTWRLVHSVMRELAPNVAMVWTPNAIPEDNYHRFYPGDQWVDWVGVNFYAVHHHNNDLSRPAYWEDPADQLNVIYAQYAARKPIMICEFAATHFCRADNRSVVDFCRDKMRMLYSALPRRYPRVKAVHWFDINTLTRRVRAGRNINNFSLTDDPQVLAAYRDVIRSPYFLSRVQTGEAREEDSLRYQPIAAGATLSGKVRLSAWVHTYSDRPVVGYRLDGVDQVALTGRPYELEWDTTQVPNGPHTLEALAFVNGRVTARTRIPLQVEN